MVKNEKNELIPQRIVIGWWMCIDYRKLNKATKKDHFALPFIDEMLERLANHNYFCFLDGHSGFMQIPIHPDDQHKTTFTCPYGTFAYRRMPFGLCNVLVEIGPEGERQHNSPLLVPLPFEGRRPEAPLGSGQRNYGLATTFAPLTDTTPRLLLT
jgi:hypothetical protein